jgi:hypothetical protein
MNRSLYCMYCALDQDLPANERLGWGYCDICGCKAIMYATTDEVVRARIRPKPRPIPPKSEARRLRPGAIAHIQRCANALKTADPIAAQGILTGLILYLESDTLAVDDAPE